MERILIIEDDELIAELERDYLEAGGFETVVELTGNKGLENVLKGGYDALVLDAMLPGKSGFEICKEVRKTLDLPIIMVTARKEEVDKIRSFGAGADDYLVKPFSLTELVARVQTHIQMHQRLVREKMDTARTELQFDPLKIELSQRRVFVGQQEIFLTNKEFEVLVLLAENPNVVFSKELLFEKVWGMDVSGSSATVDVHINRLREKIEADPFGPRWLETVWGAGYRFKL